MSNSEVAISGSIDLVKTLATNPVYSIILANCLIEILQGVEVYKGAGYGWIDVPDPINPGMGHHEYGKRLEPLISQELATTLETMINTSVVIQALGNAVGAGGIAGLIKGLIK